MPITSHMSRRIWLSVRLVLLVAFVNLAAACDLAADAGELRPADARMDLATATTRSGQPSRTVVAARTDTGVVDINRDGRADKGSYGATNRALSVGEQGGDGYNLRYLAPFQVSAATRSAVRAGSRARLAFTVWRANALGDRRLVITALPGDRRGTADFSRAGVKVYRERPKVGRMTVDVTAAVRAIKTSTITFRFATDVAPARGDRRSSQINIATADDRSGRRPKLRLIGNVTSAPNPKPTPAPRPKPRPVPRTAPAGMSVVFADEFNGSTLNTRVWKPYHSTYGDGNHELQCHTPRNVTLSGGTLKITARPGVVICPSGAVRNYSSGFLGTRETGTFFPMYGRFEIRAKVPHGQGLWPAFWLRHRRGASTAEVDIMEYFHSQVPGKTTGTLHLDRRYNLSKKTTWFEAPTASPGWHTWAVDIDGTSNGVRFTFLLDGKAYHTYTDTQRRWAGLASADGTWDMAVNLSVGGDWVGSPLGPLGYLSNLSACAQRGRPPNGCNVTGIRRAQFPATYEVDYVRVLRKK
jgi:hypothetical protein